MGWRGYIGGGGKEGRRHEMARGLRQDKGTGNDAGFLRARE